MSEAIGSEFPLSVRAGLQDSEGNIWLATSDGIARFNESRHEWSILDPFEQKVNVGPQLGRSVYADAQVIDGVYNIYEDRTGRIWFASAVLPGFHFSFDKHTKSWAHYRLVDHLPAIRPNDARLGLTEMYQDRFGRMMFGTNLGLLTFTEAENKWELYTRENSGLPDSLITTIFEDRSGRIWIGTGKGIVVLER